MMITSTALTADVQSIRLRSGLVPGVVIDSTPTYRRNPMPGYGRPEVDTDGDQVLVAVFNLAANPFVHPQSCLDDHGQLLRSVSAQDALGARRGLPRAIDAHVRIVTVDADAIEGPWTVESDLGIAV